MNEEDVIMTGVALFKEIARRIREDNVQVKVSSVDDERFQIILDKIMPYLSDTEKEALDFVEYDETYTCYKPKVQNHIV